MTDPVQSAETQRPLPIHQSPHAVALGLRFVSFDAEGATIKVDSRADLVGDPDTGVIAGGVVTALLDHACGHAVIGAMGRLAAIATLDLRIDYMRAAGAGLSVYARAHCYKITRSIAFVRATAYDLDIADPLATAQAVFVIDPAPPVSAQAVAS